MRRSLASLFGLLALSLAPTAVSAQDILAVPLDHSVRISLPPGSKRVMMGAAGIVDITVLDMRTAVLLGRTFGGTNLLVLDDAGRTLLNQEIVVSDSGSSRVTMIAGPAGGAAEGGAPAAVSIMNYACSPRCIRYPMPGDDNAEKVDYTSYPTRVGGARPAAAAPAAPAGVLGAMTAMSGVSQAMGSVASTARAVGP